jgi:hypothetical protein
MLATPSLLTHPILTRPAFNLGQLADLFLPGAKLVATFSDYRSYAGCSGCSELPRPNRGNPASGPHFELA